MLAFDGGILAVPLMTRALGTRLRVRIRAEDILLAQGAAGNQRQQCAGRANRLHQAGRRRASRRASDLWCGAVDGAITKASRERLALAQSERVFAVVKSVILDPTLYAVETR